MASWRLRRSGFARPKSTCFRSRAFSRDTESPGGQAQVAQEGVRRFAARSCDAADGGGLDVGPSRPGSGPAPSAAWPRARWVSLGDR